MPGVNGGEKQASSLPHVPESLVARGIALRAETPEDTAFLRQLYIAGRWEELSATGWPDEARVAFLSQQFAFQTQHYTTHYLGAAWGIVTQHDTPIGRLYLHQGAADLRIIDISIFTTYRNQGIGTGLIHAVFDLARQRQTRVSIHVESFNINARRLYDRLGFVQGERVGVYDRMDWTPPEQPR